MKKYLLSVVIPTKDRYIYLRDCITSLLAIDDDDIEIVIQDNTEDNSEIIEFLSTLDCTNIKYYHQTGELSQTGNSDLVVSHATGKYVCFIGDDDSISKSAIDVVRYMDKEGIKACVNNVSTYHWPDVIYEGKAKPSLTFDCSRYKIKKMISKQVLETALTNGMQDIKYLARVYHGFISRDVLEEIKEKTNTYFPGPSPDMANAVAATLLIDQYIYINMPLVISGYSYKSAGGMGLRGEHKGSLKAAKQLPKNVEDNWDPKIPKIWLGYTMWPESALKAMRSMGETNYEKKMNYAALYAKTFLRYPEYRKKAMKYTKLYVGFISFGFECVKFMCRWTWNQCKLKYRTFTNKQYVNQDKMSLQAACDITDKFISQTDYKSLIKQGE